MKDTAQFLGYACMILSGFVVVFGIVRWLVSVHQHMKKVDRAIEKTSPQIEAMSWDINKLKVARYKMEDKQRIQEERLTRAEYDIKEVNDLIDNALKQSDAE